MKEKHKKNLLWNLIIFFKFSYVINMMRNTRMVFKLILDKNFQASKRMNFLTFFLINAHIT